MLLNGIFRIGRDAELRSTPGGDSVINLSLAYNYGKKDDDGKRPTQWVDAGLWGKRAESLAKWLLKGTPIWCALEDVHMEAFSRSDGTSGTKMVGRVGQLEFAGKPAERTSAAPDAAAPPRHQPPPTAAPSAQPQRPPQTRASTGFDDMDDDIPF